MRGGFLHNRLLVTPLRKAFRSYGAATSVEFTTASARAYGFLDLVAECPDRRIAVEAELTPRRVRRDLSKAIDVGADELWIVVPTAQVARLVRRNLRPVAMPVSGPDVFVLTLGAALQRVTECFSFFSASNPTRKQLENNHQRPKHTAKKGRR